MTVPPIQRLKAKNYGCLKDVDIPLTQLHAFIGPNDSGKSTILRAIRHMVTLASSCFKYVPVRDSRNDGKYREAVVLTESRWEPYPPGILNDQAAEFSLEIQFFQGPRYSVTKKSGVYGLTERYFDEGSDRVAQSARELQRPAFEKFSGNPNVTMVRESYKGVRLVRFDPDSLRQDSDLIPSGSRVDFLDDRGFGLPGVIDHIRDNDNESYVKIDRAVRDLFPTIKKLQMAVTEKKTKELKVELTDGSEVIARDMSEGLLLFLAFCAIQHMAPVSVLLVEEPENGLHPARVAEVVKTLRAISESGTQVLIATHSPLVVNNLEPEEVTVVTRDPQHGTQVKSIKETAHFEDRKKIFALGELWVSYSNGKDENDLINGTKP